MAEATKAARARKVRIELNQKWCKACGICMAMCPKNVFDPEVGTGKAIIARPEDCSSCGMCELYCPDYAINLVRGEQE